MKIIYAPPEISCGCTWGFGKKRRRSGLLLLAYDSSTNLKAKLILTPNMFSIIYFAMFVASV